MSPRRTALRAALAAAGIAGAPAALTLTPLVRAQGSLIEEPRVLARQRLGSARLSGAGSPVIEPGFTPRRGSLWVLVHVLAALHGSVFASEASLDIVLDGLSMTAGQGVHILRARWMHKPEPADWIRDPAGRRLSPFTAQPIAQVLSVPESSFIEAALAQDGERLMQATVLHRIDVRRPEGTTLVIRRRRESGLRLLMIEAEAGQGPLPREREQWLDKASGRWWQRYRYEATGVGVGVLAGGVLLHRLWRL